MSESSSLIQIIRGLHPRIHCITNPVTIEECANMLLACGASPIMAHHPEETAEVSSHSQALVLNMGHTTAYDAMISAGRMCRDLRHPVVLDPVGVGISTFRRNAFLRLCSEFPLTVIRGNASEIRILEELTRTEAGQSAAEAEPAGIDIAPGDALTADNRSEHIRLAQTLAARLHCVAVMSGAADLVCSADRYQILPGGSVEMSRITGSGCMLSAMMGAWLAADPARPFEAACDCVRTMNLAAEEAERRMRAADGGTMTFRMYLIDAVSRM